MFEKNNFIIILWMLLNTKTLWIILCGWNGYQSKCRFGFCSGLNVRVTLAWYIWVVWIYNQLWFWLFMRPGDPSHCGLAFVSDLGEGKHTSLWFAWEYYSFISVISSIIIISRFLFLKCKGYFNVLFENPAKFWCDIDQI